MQCSHCQTGAYPRYFNKLPARSRCVDTDSQEQSTCFWSIPYPIRSSTLVLISALTALVLFRIDGALWPLYLFVLLVVIGMFAVVFSG